MVRILRGTTKGTKSRTSPVLLTNLVGRRETTSKGLLEENFNLRRNSGPPDAGKSIRRGTSDEPRVQRFN